MEEKERESEHPVVQACDVLGPRQSSWRTHVETPPIAPLSSLLLGPSALHETWRADVVNVLVSRLLLF